MVVRRLRSAECTPRYEERCGVERELELQRPTSIIEHLMKNHKQTDDEQLRVGVRR